MGRYNLDGYVPSVFVSFSEGVHVDSPDVSAVFTPFLGLQRAASFRRYLSATRLGDDPSGSSPVSPGFSLSIYLSMRGFIIHLNGPDSNHVTHQNEDGG